MRACLIDGLPFFFNASILENIRSGRPEAACAEVVAAARAACAHDSVLGQDEGYDTLVGEGAVALSGGEKRFPKRQFR